MKTIETNDLKNVTGGCAACGGNCANGPAPQQQQGAAAGKQPGGEQSLSNPFAQQGARR
jgi:bacteriocin-like protein